MTPERHTYTSRAILRLAQATETIAAVLRPRDDASVAPAVEQMLVRHLGVAHLGRWIELPARPHREGPRVAHEPSLIAQGGRLVGFHAHTNPQRSPSVRVLVLLAGTPVEVPCPVDDPVLVAPREWS